MITSRVCTGISLIALAVAATLITLLVLTCRPAVAASQDAPPYVIAVHLSSENRSATGPEEVHAIRHFVTRRVELLNASGGINGRRVAVAFFDDHSDGEETKANVDRALTIPNLIAMVGLSNSTRGAPVVERIGNSGVPLISEISVETLFADYPNIFSLTRSVRDELIALGDECERHYVHLGIADIYSALKRRLGNLPGWAALASGWKSPR